MLGFGVVILIFLLFGVFTLYHFKIVSQLTRTIHNHPLAVSNAALDAKVSITKIHRTMKDVVLSASDSDIQNFILVVNEQENQVFTYLDILGDKILGEAGKQLEKEARILFEAWRPIREEVIRLVRNGEKEAAALVTTGPGADHVALLEEKMLKLNNYARDKAWGFLQKTDEAHFRINLTLILFLVLGTLASSLIAVFVLKESKSAQTQLLQSKNGYRSLIESQTDLVCRFTGNGVFTFVNQVYCDFFNKSSTELIGKTWQPLPVDDDLAGIEEKLMSLSPANALVVIENRVYSGEGKIHWMQFANKGFFDGAGHLTEIQSVGRDITELKKALEKINRQNTILDAISRVFLDTLTCDGVADVAKSCLSIAREITHSQHGSVAEVNPNGLGIIASSHPGWETGKLQESSPEGRNMEIQDLWKRALTDKEGIICNDPKKHPGTFGVSGETFLRTSFLGIGFGGTTKLVMGLGNKTGGYTAKDLSLINALTFAFAAVIEREQARMVLRENEEKYRVLFQSASDAVLMVDVETMDLVDANDAAVKLYGYQYEQLLQMKIIDLSAEVEKTKKILQKSLALFIPLRYHRNKEGRVFPVEVKANYFRLNNRAIYLGNIRDITEKIEGEKERQKLESQLRQSQKMEAVGRLAGGVAHDYNNALSVIMGFTELAMETVDPAGSLHENLNEVLTAANRAADITRQLLAFARKQTISPRTLDLNESVGSLLKMLRHLIGEDIDLAWLPGKTIWSIKMDPSQLDQILANLCINARDAIEGVGKITIETDTIVFDAAYCADHQGFIPGEFVMLAVGDNGCGIDKALLNNIFEPFFTTKDVDKGTGLGLSTVYGIVKQNNGFINVYSEPDKGTSIKIYLPRHGCKALETQEEKTKTLERSLGETILLVEDHIPVLELTQKILDRFGYKVLTARTPWEAMGIAREYPKEIHLLITDVVMPEMNGRELADRLLANYPAIKIVFMSGYTANVIVHHGVLAKGVHFVQKPFSRGDLAKIIRKALEG